MPRKGTLLPNLVGNLGGFAFSMLIGLWYTPYLLHRLGTAEFGLVPLATTVTGYLSLVTIAFTNSLARFFTIAVERDDREECSRVFNTALFGGMVLLAATTIPAVAIAFWGGTFAKVPANAAHDVRVLFGLATAGFLLTVGAAPYNIATFARNRLELRTLGDVIYNAVRVLVVVALFRLLKPQLWAVGLGLLLAAVASSAYSVYWSHRLLPLLRV